MRNSKLMLMAGVCLGVAYLGGPAQAADEIYLEVSPCGQCVRSGEMIDVAVKVKNLQRRIHMVTAQFTWTGTPCGGTSVGTVCVEKVQPGEPFWTDVLISTSGQTTDFIMGLQPAEFRAVGTIADNTVARIRLKACAEGNITLAISGTAKLVTDCVFPDSPQPTTAVLTAAQPVTVCIDDTPPEVTITEIKHENCSENLLLPPCPCETGCPAGAGCLEGSCETALCAGPGNVKIKVTATDVCSCKALHPSVQVITACGTVTDITCDPQDPSAREWTFTFKIDDKTEPGLATVRAQVTDCAGNVSLEALGSFQICPVLTISGLVELQDFTGSLREVYFTVYDKDGNRLPTYIQVLQFSRNDACFSNLVAPYVLHVPDKDAGDITKIQAKTAWNLSTTIAIDDTNQFCGHLVVNFTGLAMLLSGDVAWSPGCGRFKLGGDTVNDDDLAFVNHAVGTAMNAYNYWADVNGDGVVTTTDEELVLQNLGASAVPPFEHLP